MRRRGISDTAEFLPACTSSKHKTVRKGEVCLDFFVQPDAVFSYVTQTPELATQLGSEYNKSINQYGDGKVCKDVRRYEWYDHSRKVSNNRERKTALECGMYQWH